MPDNEQAYLGDGVYAELERGHIKLTVNYGRGPEPVREIYMDDEVLSALDKFRKRIAAKSN